MAPIPMVWVEVVMRVLGEELVLLVLGMTVGWCMIDVLLLVVGILWIGKVGGLERRGDQQRMKASDHAHLMILSSVVSVPLGESSV